VNLSLLREKEKNSNPETREITPNTRNIKVCIATVYFSFSLIGVVKWYNATKGFGFITVDELGIDAAFQIRGICVLISILSNVFVSIC
jgi:hypothetical protein